MQNPADHKYSAIDLSVDLPGLKMKNPILTASGTFGFGEDYAKLYDLSILGSMTTKAVSIEPRRGNPMPRIAETPAGMLNAIGLQNPGFEAAQHKINALRAYDLPILVNVAGHSFEEYIEVTKALSDLESVDALEINISCPNVREGGITFGTSAQMVEELTAKIKKVSKKPIYMKLSPNVTDIVELAKAAEAGGADGLSLINTLLGMRLNLQTGKPILANGTGGLSGPAIKPVAIRMIYQVAKAVSLPIIGMGGASTVEDVLEFLYAGASCVAIGTANFTNPMVCPEIIQKLPEALAKHGFQSAREAIRFSHR